MIIARMAQRGAGWVIGQPPPEGRQACERAVVRRYFGARGVRQRVRVEGAIVRAKGHRFPTFYSGRKNGRKMGFCDFR